MTQQFMSEDISKISLALAKFQGSVPNIPKNCHVNYPTKNTYGNEKERVKYSYADLADIIKITSKALAEVELSVVQFFVNEGTNTYLTTILSHSSGQWIRSQILIHREQPLQALGSELTYLRRYSLSSILGICADEDEDGAIANDVVKETVTKKPAAKVATASSKITEEQKETLIDLAVQIDDLNFMPPVLKDLGVSKIEDVHPDEYQKAYNILARKVNSKGAPKYVSKTA
jgi:ERF superfamily